jgi:transcription initiation factor TFIIB
MTTPIEKTIQKRRIQSCPECKSHRIAERVEEECSICLDCGFVISAETAKLIAGQKAKAIQYNHARRDSRSVTAPPSIEKKESNQEKIINALEQWKQVKIWDSTERNLALALEYVTKIAADLSLSSNVLEKASLMYKRIVEKGLVQGRSMKAVCVAVIFVGCKQCDEAITIRDLAAVSKLNSKKIDHAYRSIVKHLMLPVKTTRLSNHSSEIATRLQLSARTNEVVEKIVESLDGCRCFVGKSPTGIVCAAVYIASLLTGERKSQREIAAAGKLTEATLRSRCREIEISLTFSFGL